MEIVLNLKKSINNYDWKSKSELKAYINYMLKLLWQHQLELANGEIEYDGKLDCVDLENRLYDILDMFTNYEIRESDKNESINN